MERKRAVLVNGLLLIVVAVAAIVFLIVRNNSDSNQTSDPVELSAQQSAEDAIANGVTAENSGDALFLAGQLVGSGDLDRSRELLEQTNDADLSNQDLQTKYSTLMSTYMSERDRAGFEAALERYKQALNDSGDPDLQAYADSLNQAYIDAVFTTDTTPVEEEDS